MPQSYIVDIDENRNYFFRLDQYISPSKHLEIIVGKTVDFWLVEGGEGHQITSEEASKYLPNLCDEYGNVYKPPFKFIGDT